MKNFKTPFLSAIVFFGTLLVLSAAYATWTSLVSSDADGGKVLSSTLLKAMINNINDVGTRTDGIYSSGGNIGIGTTSPIGKFDVLSNSAGGFAKDFRISFKDAGATTFNYGATQGIAFTSDSAQTDYVVLGISASHSQNAVGLNSWKITGGGGSVANMLLTPSGGNVGIGIITAPAEKLEVNGAIRVTDNGIGNGRIRPKYVASVSTTPVIVGRVGYGGLFVVIGWNGTGQFSDLVFYAYGNAPQVISSKTVAGTPAARTYAASLYDFTLQMASGTYEISSVGMTN